MNQLELAGYLDDTLLKPEATKEQIIAICKEAKECQTASVCVNSCYASLVTEQLKGSEVKTCCVVGFPLGACTTKTKAFETKDAIENGAKEIDMVIQVGAVKDKDWDYVKEDVAAVVKEAEGKALVKVIIEACLLTDEEKTKVCQICKEAGADFVKTSTGFSTGGATVEDVKRMRNAVGLSMGVKAAGGIRDEETAKAMIEAGASRIGASSAGAILGIK